MFKKNHPLCFKISSLKTECPKLVVDGQSVTDTSEILRQFTLFSGSLAKSDLSPTKQPTCPLTLTLAPINPSIAHADSCGRNIEKNTWSKNKDCTRTLRYSSLQSGRVLLLSSNPESYLQRFRLQVVLKHGCHSNPRRALKLAQEQEDRRRRRNERDRARRAAETAEQRPKGVKD